MHGEGSLMGRMEKDSGKLGSTETVYRDELGPGREPLTCSA